jgi:shikimate dehydrogenase
MSQNIKQLVIANRSLDKAQLIAHYDNSLAVTFEQLASIDTAFDLIIHSSSLGHQGKTLKFFSHQFHSTTICYDLSYAQAALPFLNFSKEMGVTHSYDGIGMLIEQAAKSFEIWFNLMADSRQVKVL